MRRPGGNNPQVVEDVCIQGPNKRTPTRILHVLATMAAAQHENSNDIFWHCGFDCPADRPRAAFFIRVKDDVVMRPPIELRTFPRRAVFTVPALATWAGYSEGTVRRWLPRLEAQRYIERKRLILFVSVNGVRIDFRATRCIINPATCWPST